MHRVVHLKNRIFFIWILIKISILFAIPIVIIITPNSYVFSGPTICLINNIFGIDCLGCGITRAIFLVFDGDLITAFELNERILLVLSILFILWIKLIYKQILEGLYLFTIQVGEFKQREKMALLK